MTIADGYGSGAQPLSPWVQADPAPRLGPHRHRSTCRACGSPQLELFLSLGATALANEFLRSVDEIANELVYPLEVYFCENCSLVQLLDVVDPSVLFGEYIYVTGTSETIAAHNRTLARSLVQSRGLGTEDVVVEIASNDGSLLKCFKDHGVRTLGVEPADNIAELARGAGIETVSRFFDADVGRELRAEHGPAAAVIANNVLAHVDEPLGFLTGCRELLSRTGVLSVEVPYIRPLLERVEYDTIYHEHLSYFSIRTVRHLMAEAGLKVRRITHLPIHGGSLRVEAGPAEEAEGEPAGVFALVEREKRAGLADLDTYRQFARRVAESREATLDLLNQLRRAGAAVAGYGAPAKGNTLLSFCGITTDLIPYTVDKNPLKIGKLTPGTHIPVLPIEAIDERRPDYLFLLAWNFADEIVRQQSVFAERGGKFIVPVPSAEVLAA